MEFWNSRGTAVMIPKQKAPNYIKSDERILDGYLNINPSSIDP